MIDRTNCKSVDPDLSAPLGPLSLGLHSLLRFGQNKITKTRLYSFDPLKPHFYVVKLGFTGVYIIFLISAQKHRL